jgi:hypothetical protein
MANLCLCGCGKEIVIKPWHKWRGIPKYLHGHCKNSLGRKHSEESKKKMSDALKGRTAWNKGKEGCYSEETIEKIKSARAKQVMKKGRKHSEESKEKNRIAHLGKQHTEQSKKKLSVAAKGRKLSEAQKIKLSKGKLGEKNPQWQGGISKLPYGQDWTEDLKDAIRKRDEHTCQICGETQEEFGERLGRKLTVHHIDYDKNNCNPDNLTTLCISCHTKTGTNRKYWKLFFTTSFQEEEKNGNVAVLTN